MDPRLLEHYNLELQHLREMGAEFAEQFPKIAGRLGMNGLDVADPYVERLLEGVAFMAARVQLKLDAEFPRFTQALLEMVYPHYLAPTPAMLVAQLIPDLADPNLVSGPTVPRGTAMHSHPVADDGTACEFRTARDLRLWPLAVATASYFSFAGDLPLATLRVAQRIKGGLRIRLTTGPGLTLSQLPIDRLPIYFSGREDVANALFELCVGSGLGVMVVIGSGPARRIEFLPASAIQQIGFGADEALLPTTLRSLHGYRVLQEYFAFSQRFRFIELTGLANVFRGADTSELELVIPFGRGEQTLENVADASNIALFCAPAVNLFARRADRIHVTDGTHEYHVVPDRTRPLDFEVYEVTKVVGHGIGSESEQRFRPFYSAYSGDNDQQQSAYFAVRREPRLLSETQKRRGTRTSYVGSEVFLSLVDPHDAPFSGELRQLSVHTVCTNRDLPLLMPLGGAKTDLLLDAVAPLAGIRVVAGPSRPYAPLADGAVAWRAVNHLSLNYLSIVNTSARDGAAALRDLLSLYAGSAGLAARHQVQGIRSVDVRRVVRRLPGDGPLTFGRGLEITITIDELAFAGTSAFTLGSVLSRYFAAHVSMNSFTETVLRSDERGEINRWMPQWGARPTL